MERLFTFDGHGLNLPPRYNVAPTQDVPIIRREEGERRLAMVRWGLVPSWSKELPKSKPLINARSETVAEKPSFRSAYGSRRCLVMADGFYEWKRSEKTPLPFYVSPAAGGMFAMAGVWERWQPKQGDGVESVAIITTSANETLSAIHHRMPVVIDPDNMDDWLSADSDREVVDPLLKPAPNDFFVMTPVSVAVNKIANDGPELIEPADHTKPPEAASKSGQLSLL